MVIVIMVKHLSDAGSFILPNLVPFTRHGRRIETAAPAWERGDG